MNEQRTIRPATPSDAAAISRLVVLAVQRTNAKDYPPEVVAEVVRDFSPAGVAGRMRGRSTLVAVEYGKIVGTGSLEGEVVRSVFVLPNRQGRGIGKDLMRELENLARANGIVRLSVPASVTAEGFYGSLGYLAMRDEYHGDERTIIMEKAL